MVYIATPHSHYHDVAMEAKRKGKPCLVEKSFMANAREAGEVLDLAAERKVFVAEAIWTRYMPSARMLRELIDRGEIDRVVSNCILSPSGVDLQDSMSFTFRDGVMADLHCSG